MPSVRTRGLVPIPLLALALAIGCSDEKPPGATDDGLPPEIPRTFRVLIAQPEDVDVNVQQTVMLQAFLYKPDGSPAVGEPVQFELLHNDPAGNPGEAVLMAAEVTVDDVGLAQVEFLAGSVGDVDLTVQITASGAPQEKHIVVHVLNYPVGTIEVSVDYDGPVTVGPIDVYLMSGENRCPYNAIRVPMGEIATATVPRVGETIIFGPFVEGSTYTLYARGIVHADGMETLGAQGCFDGIVVPGGEAAKIPLQMMLIPMNPVGSYDVQNHYDFTDAIPGTVGDVIRNIDALFNDTGNWLIDRIQDGIQLFASSVLGFVGDLLGRAVNWVVDRFFQDVLANAIDNWIDSSAPDWLKDFFVIGRDLLQVVNNLEVLSLMTFDKVASDFRLAGETTWAGVALYWRIDCEEGDPPTCGRHEFRIEQLLDTEYPLEIVWARFGARVVPYNGLKLDQHDINLQYGRLILFVLNEMLLPRIANGARSITDALLNAFDCEDLARSMTGDDGVWGVCLPDWAFGQCIGVEDDDIKGWCEGAARLLGGMAADLIGGLAIDSRLTLAGECKMFEDNQDLLVDRLEDGTWTGTVRVGADQGNPFSGDWRGCRRQRGVEGDDTFYERCPWLEGPTQ